MRKLFNLVTLGIIFIGLIYFIYQRIDGQVPAEPESKELVTVSDKPNLESLKAEIGGLPWESDSDAILAKLEPVIELIPTRYEVQKMPVGQSRFGGQPDLPEGQEWPLYEGKPMAFLAQINLAEYDSLWFPSGIPGRTILYYFSWIDPKPRFDSLDYTLIASNQKFLLAYAGPHDQLKTATFPKDLPKNHRFWPYTLPEVYHYALPAHHSLKFDGLGLGKNDQDLLWNWNEKHANFNHQLFGEPYSLKSGLATKWAQASMANPTQNLPDASESGLDTLSREFVNLLNFETFPAFENMGSAKGFWSLDQSELKHGLWNKSVLVFE